MDLGLKDKVALVAAASQGLGLAVATASARRARVLPFAGATRRASTAAAETIRTAGGGEVFTVVADVAQGGDVRRFVDDAAAHFGRVDILVINAGGPPSGEFLDLDEEAWRKGVDLTLMSAVSLCYAAVPHMQKAGGGRIIAITSVSVKQPIRNLTLSNSIRAAVVGLTKTLSIELAPHNILVNAVLPRLDPHAAGRRSAERPVRQEAGCAASRSRRHHRRYPAEAYG